MSDPAETEATTSCPCGCGKQVSVTEALMKVVGAHLAQKLRPILHTVEPDGKSRPATMDETFATAMNVTQDLLGLLMVRGLTFARNDKEAALAEMARHVHAMRGAMAQGHAPGHA